MKSFEIVKLKEKIVYKKKEKRKTDVCVSVKMKRGDCKLARNQSDVRKLYINVSFSLTFLHLNLLAMCVYVQ